MATIAQIRDGIKDRLATISGLRPFDYVTAGVTPPAAVVYPETITYGSSQGDQTHDPTMVILVLVGLSNDKAAQDQLDAYLDPTGTSSIPAAVNGTLAGIVDYAVVTQVREYGQVMFGDGQYLGAKLVVEVGMR